MTAEFTCTLEDYVEALRVHRGAAPGQRVGWRERLLFLWILIGAFVLLFTVALGEGIYAAAKGAPPGTTLVATNWLSSILAPWVLWLICFGFIWFAFSGALARTDVVPIRNLMLILLAAAFALSVVGSLFTTAQPTTQPVAASAEEANYLTTLAPWLLVFFVIWTFIFRFLRGAARRNWDAQPHLRLPVRMEQTERGLRFVNEHTTYDYAWPAFLKYAEGPGVFLLFVSQLAFQMVPKRAFADAAQLDEFRQLLARHVPSANPRPGGFPVSPATPLPVLTRGPTQSFAAPDANRQR